MSYMEGPCLTRSGAVGLVVLLYEYACFDITYTKEMKGSSYPKYLHPAIHEAASRKKTYI